MGEMGGRFKKERIYVHLWLMHVKVWQKITKFCKAIILQLKNKFKKKCVEMEKGSERGALRTTKEGSGIHTIWLFYRFYQVLFPHAWKYMLSTPFPFARTGMCSAQGHAVKLVAGETSTQGSWLHIQCLHAHSTHIPPLQAAGWSGSDEGMSQQRGKQGG